MAEAVAVPNEVVNGEATGSSETTEKSTNEKVTELALNLLAQGRRHLLVSDIPAAITALAESCRLLGELYGDFADECAESYYYYGVALLEMARTDADVLGDAVEGGEKDGSDSDEDEEENEDEEPEGDEEKKDEKSVSEATDGDKVDTDKTEEPKSEVVKAEEGTSSQVSEAKEEKPKAEVPEPESKPDAPESSSDVDMKEATPAESSSNGAAEINKEEESAGSKEAVKPKSEGKGKALKPVGATSETKATENGDDGEDIAEDVSNLQLAWEMFELAKKIYQKKVEADASLKPKLADALIRLAEVAIESENYASAIEDLKNCLEIQHASFAPDSRSLAETFYQLGVAYTFTTEFQEAIKNFESAAKVIELRIENLKNPKERSLSMEEPKPFFHTIEGELEELEALLPDIKEKIADTIDLEKEAARKIAENGVNGSGPSSSKENGSSLMEAEPSTTNGMSPSSSKPATDISHLIRKKRKPEDQEAEASAAKKVCSELPAADVSTA